VSGMSIRARLTAWYVGVLTIAIVALASASVWLSTESVIRATDIGLRARVEGVRDFLDNPRTRLAIEDLRDEFSEYAELTRGEALLEVVNGSGVVLCRPAIPGWIEMAEQSEPFATSGDVRPADRMLGRLPFRVASAHLRSHGQIYRVTVAAPMGPAYGALDRFHRLLFVLLPGVIILAGAGGYWISRRALAPVDQVTRVVQAITVQNLDQRLELPPADDELRRLASTFNHVLARLESAVADIVRFTADASHELRTPVSLIRTTAELALRHERAPEEYRTALAEVGRHTQHMSELVDDLLVLARTDAGIEPRETAALDLRNVATEACRDVAEVACRQSVKVNVHLPADPVCVQGDAVSLRRLLLILLDNAVKYSIPGGEVRLRLDVTRLGQNGMSAVFEIADEGIGLDASETARVFERFYRGARARQHAPDGTGLGLAIAQTIVNRYHGNIELTASNGNGRRGCHARVTLPLRLEKV
jgi:signal transduction histidine kinase